MYEKPLYPTPDGYKRSQNNPYRKKCLREEVEELKRQIRKQDEPTPAGLQPNTPQKSAALNSARRKVQLSEKAAQLIASAIKTLLRSK